MDLDSGKGLDLKEIGIQRTPYYRLSQREKARMAIKKRPDFNYNLKNEQILVDSNRRRSLSKEKWIYQSLERGLSESPVSALRIQDQSLGTVNASRNSIVNFLEHSEVNVSKHLTNLRYKNGVYEVYKNTNNRY